MSALNIGDTILLYGKKVRIVERKEENICNQCQIHHLCNREYQEMREEFKRRGVKTCSELIGHDRCFEIVKTQ